MSSSELRNRANWQTISGARALKTEEIFQEALQNGIVNIRSVPKCTKFI